MGLQIPAYELLHPSFMEPEIFIQYSQPSGFLDLLAGGTLRNRIATDDLVVYAKQLNLRTKVAAGQAGGFQELPGVDISMSMMSTATYMLKTRAQYDHHDTNAGSRWGISVPDAYRKAMWQGNFQLCRDFSLYGASPQNGEGLVNAPNAVAVNLPPDSNGQTSVQLYDNGEMAFYLSQVILAIKTRTLQLGIGKEFTILGPQRTLGLFQYNVVQLTQFQRDGAGVESTFGTLEAIVGKNGDKIIWVYDDTLIGQGDAGADLVIVCMPKVSKPKKMSEIDTNYAANIIPGNEVCVTQYCDKPAPTEIVSPLAAGATDVVTEWRVSSGWAPRGQAITLISMPY